ncbi:hypothetical protein Q7P37_008217 [Cladosporium fusiforme]
MLSPQTSAPSICALILLLLGLALPTIAQTTFVDGTFQAAIWASDGNDQNQDLTEPAKAQCPANFPQSCSTIGEGAYCCPSGATCQYSDNNQVGCCSSSSGGKCSGSLSNGNAYQPTSHYKEPQPTPTYVDGGAGAYNPPTTTVVQQGGFCTTIIAEGDGLPTTANARCGTALVVEAGADGVGRKSVLGLVAVLQVLGAWFVLRRW